MMRIYPAIDLIGGACVRLYKGDFDQMTSYEQTPVSMAQRYADEGAGMLHLVDLDGARDPKKRQLEMIARIIKATDLTVQTGGGVRTSDDVRALLDIGATRVVIGSLAVKDPDLTKDIFKTFGSDKICLALDVMEKGDDFCIAVAGWQETTTTTLFDIIDDYTSAGLKHILCTDIGRDGTLQGANIGLYQKLCEFHPDIQVQASGGVGTLRDIAALQKTGVYAAIVGKAIYEDRFTVRNAVATGRGGGIC